MFNIFCHQRNANSGFYLYSSRIAMMEKMLMWMGDSTYSLLVEVRIGTTTGKWMWRALRKLERDTPLDPAVLFSGTYSDDSVFYDRDTCLSVSNAGMLTTAGIVNNLDAHQHFNG